MQTAAQAYSRTAKTSVTPRQLESTLLMRAAAKLQSAKDNWQANNDALDEALMFNRKLWTVLVSSVTKEENPLPDPIKQNIANLGVFIFSRTIELELEPEKSKMDILVTINKEIAAGLQGSAT